jgi:hypothetical protein
VKTNKGAPGIDGMTVDDLLPWLVEHKQELRSSLRVPGMRRLRRWKSSAGRGERNRKVRQGCPPRGGI